MDIERASQDVTAVKEKLACLRRETTLVFPLFSDLHADSVSHERTRILVAALQELCKEIRPDAVIDLGDNVTMLGRDTHISNKELSAVLTAMFDTVYRAVSCPLFLVNGNHDAIGTDFFKPTFWNGIVKGKYDDGHARYGAEGAWYYVDYDRADTRLVFLSLPHDSDLTADNPTPCWAFGERQLTWLREEALHTEHTVLLFVHVPLYFREHTLTEGVLEVWDGKKTAMTPIINLCGWIDDVQEAAAIIKEAGNVAACFSGHTHEDSLWMPYEQVGEDTNPLPCPQVVTRTPVPQDGKPGLSVDILVWDAIERVAHLLRLGDGEDREISV